MATYKVIQDIEAEDKLIGWMTPRQTIYAAIVIVSAFMWFLMATNGAWWLGIIFLPHMVLLTVLSGPFVHDQPSEVWLLAKIKFHLLPRRRIWDQSGLKELVTITVPKKIERRLTDGLSQTEVKSRLSALANTIDSRGWAVKNVNVNLYAQPAYADVGSDRLIDTNSFPQAVPSFEVTAQDDILDERSNPVAQHLEQMITQSTQAHRQQVLQQMQNPASTAKPAGQPADYWFLNATAGQQVATQPGYATFDHNQMVAPGAAAPMVSAIPDPTTNDQQALLDKIHTESKKSKRSNKHLHTIKTLEEQQQEKAEQKKAAAQKQALERPAPSQTAQQLSQNNDLNISTIARQASQAKKPDDGEVVISLR
jgi:hypothetical protein